MKITVSAIFYMSEIRSASRYEEQGFAKHAHFQDKHRYRIF